MKWIHCLLMTAGIVSIAATAPAATMTGATFTMLDPSGGPVGVDSTVTGSIGDGAWSVASTTTFFGSNWTAHGGTTFGPGTYTFDTLSPDHPEAVYTGVVVAAGQVGGHILFNWSSTSDIDVINVWDVNVTGGEKSYTSTDGPATHPVNPDGVRGYGMLDGAFSGFNANFDFTVASCGDGVVDTAANTKSIDVPEGCDDGNTAAGDGCAATCTVESGYACSGEPSTCDGICGDGLIRGTEACDDGNADNTDGCLTTCEAASCGDG
ncbi:MAG: hypothetical protein AUK30_07190, partial [Nitrospirae bacterium CG2_30_70_394]